MNVAAQGKLEVDCRSKHKSAINHCSSIAHEDSPLIADSNKENLHFHWKELVWMQTSSADSVMHFIQIFAVASVASVDSKVNALDVVSVALVD